MDTINYLAVITAAASTFVIGGIWYSPLLFESAWLRANGRMTSDTSGRAAVFGLSFIFALVMAANLAMFLNAPDTTATWGAGAGALAAIWVDLAIATIALFERRPFAYTVINGGYWLVAFVVMGLIIGAWR